MSHYTLNIAKLFPYKDRQPVLHNVGVVYQLTCRCDQKYLDQTKQNLITCLNKHQTCQSSNVCRHLIENPTHTINFDSLNNWEISNHDKTNAAHCQMSSPI